MTYAWPIAWSSGGYDSRWNRAYRALLQQHGWPVIDQITRGEHEATNRDLEAWRKLGKRERFEVTEAGRAALNPPVSQGSAA